MKLTGIAHIYQDLKKDMQVVERELSAAIETDHPVLNEAAHHLLRAGGKRIRPIFVLLAGKFGDYSIDRLKYVAVPLELIHMATLVHDDVIDDAATRRGRPTVKSKWDNKIAMYTGDYILGRSLSIVSRLSDPEVHKLLSDAIVEMVKGEIEQIRDFFNWKQNLRRYLRRIKRKTALLIAVSCQLGGMVSGASERHVRALYHFGYNAGMAFQITDDILDFTGTAKQLGKPAGSDLRQGNVTLPVLYALNREEETKKRQIHAFLQSEGEAVPIDDMVRLIRNSEGIRFAQALADTYLSKAIHALNELPLGKYRDSLKQIAHFIGERSY